MAAGNEYNASVVTRATAAQAHEAVIAGVSEVRGYTEQTAGTYTIFLTRRYTPTWAIVLGVCTLPILLIGVLAFFIKDKETLTVAISAAEDGTSVRASGLASPAMAQYMNGVFDGLRAAV